MHRRLFLDMNSETLILGLLGTLPSWLPTQSKSNLFSWVLLIGAMSSDSVMSGGVGGS